MCAIGYGVAGLCSCFVDDMKKKWSFKNFSLTAVSVCVCVGVCLCVICLSSRLGCVYWVISPCYGCGYHAYMSSCGH